MNNTGTPNIGTITEGLEIKHLVELALRNLQRDYSSDRVSDVELLIRNSVFEALYAVGTPSALQIADSIHNDMFFFHMNIREGDLYKKLQNFHNSILSCIDSMYHQVFVFNSKYKEAGAPMLQLLLFLLHYSQDEEYRKLYSSAFSTYVKNNISTLKDVLEVGQILGFFEYKTSQEILKNKQCIENLQLSIENEIDTFSKGFDNSLDELIISLLILKKRTFDTPEEKDFYIKKAKNALQEKLEEKLGLCYEKVNEKKLKLKQLKNLTTEQQQIFTKKLDNIESFLNLMSEKKRLSNIISRYSICFGDEENSFYFQPLHSSYLIADIQESHTRNRFDLAFQGVKEQFDKAPKGIKSRNINDEIKNYNDDDVYLFFLNEYRGNIDIFKLYKKFAYSSHVLRNAFVNGPTSIISIFKEHLKILISASDLHTLLFGVLTFMLKNDGDFSRYTEVINYMKVSIRSFADLLSEKEDLFFMRKVDPMSLLHLIFDLSKDVKNSHQIKKKILGFYSFYVHLVNYKLESDEDNIDNNLSKNVNYSYEKGSVYNAYRLHVLFEEFLLINPAYKLGDFLELYFSVFANISSSDIPNFSSAKDFLHFHDIAYEIFYSYFQNEMFNKKNKKSLNIEKYVNTYMTMMERIIVIFKQEKERIYIDSFGSYMNNIVLELLKVGRELELYLNDDRSLVIQDLLIMRYQSQIRQLRSTNEIWNNCSHKHIWEIACNLMSHDQDHLPYLGIQKER